MAFSDHFLERGEPIWDAQKSHRFVRELSAGTLDKATFVYWVRQDYCYLLDYARVFAIAGTKAHQDETMTHLLRVAHGILDVELDLHREFAADYGIGEGLDRVEKAPTCVAYTNFLVRTAHVGSLAEIAAAINPCGQGYLDIAEHGADFADEDHRYMPFIEKYTSEEFYEAVDWVRAFVDRCGERYPGERKAMERAFLTSAKLEHRFWEMADTREDWDVSEA
ncbi:thiaminase II [Natronococcus occultus]|uniref:Putative transcription activator n=1 Tax=Natronococcus occultus SP4 TaxID=694430 RepID=L0JX16_9EURY|nr:thiaminase II [Natronococcus occultus]AGB37286.1 putative transcription activator [Natronococcus occultus SP4]